MLRRALGTTVYEEIRGRLLSEMAGSFALLIGRTFLFFLAGIALARLLEADGYGAYRYALTWVSILAVLGTLGLEHLGVRKVASLHAEDAWPRLRGFVAWGDWAAGGFSMLLVVTALVAVPVALRGQELALWTAVRVGILVLPIEVLIKLRQATLQGVKRPLLGQVPGALIRPALVGVGAAVLMLAFGEGGLTAVPALVLYVGTAIVALGSADWWVRRNLPPGDRQFPDVKTARRWLGETAPMMLIGAMYVINNYADILLLGFLAEPRDVGLYAVASRGGQLVVFGLNASNKVLAPEFARLHTQEATGRLQRVLTGSTRVLFVASLPVVVVLWLFGSYFLSLFGPEFDAAYLALAILAGSQMLSVAAGPVGFLLMMTNHERVAARNVGISAVVNIAFNVVLIPRYGIEGAAVATALSIAVVNILQAVAVARLTTLRPTVLARMHS